MAMKWKPAAPEAMAAFAAATKRVEGLDHRKMFGYDAVFANDRMVGGLHEAGMVLRLPDADRERFVAEHGGKAFVVMGRTMREYVVVPETLLDDTKTLERWVRRGRDYAASMPPKDKAKSRSTGPHAATAKPGPSKAAAPKSKAAVPKSKAAVPKSKAAATTSKAASAAKKRPSKAKARKAPPRMPSKAAPGRKH